MYRISHTVQRVYYNVIHKDVSFYNLLLYVYWIIHTAQWLPMVYTHRNELTLLTFFGALKTLSHESGELEATTRGGEAEYDWELWIGLCF